MTDGMDDSRSNGSDDEDAELLWQATARAEALLADLAADQVPTTELDALLGYLREVVLARISEEEQQVFPVLQQVDSAHRDVDRLHQDHLLLREDVDDLAAAAAAHGPADPDRLAMVTRGLIARLEEHLRHEAAVLTTLPGGYDARVSGWAGAEHWYPLTEGSRINVDRLRPDQGQDAVLNRLSNLRVGEHVELCGHVDTEPLRRRLQCRAPDGYSWSERRDDGGSWTVSVARRPAD